MKSSHHVRRRLSASCSLPSENVVAKSSRCIPSSKAISIAWVREDSALDGLSESSHRKDERVDPRGQLIPMSSHKLEDHLNDPYPRTGG
jgi:hypothetical protein